MPSNQYQAVDKTIQTKSKQQEMKGRKKTQEFVYLVRSNADLLWGTEQLSVPL